MQAGDGNGRNVVPATGLRPTRASLIEDYVAQLSSVETFRLVGLSRGLDMICSSESGSQGPGTGPETGQQRQKQTAFDGPGRGLNQKRFGGLIRG